MHSETNNCSMYYLVVKNLGVERCIHLGEEDHYTDGMSFSCTPDLEFPGAGNEIITRKGKTMDRDDFERMKDEYYSLRKWDVSTGLQKKEHMKKLGLTFVCDEIDKLGLLKRE